MRLRASAVVFVGTLVSAACGGGSPAQPTAAGTRPSVGASGGSAHVTNAAPILNWKTTPRADLKAQPYPAVSGVIPFGVRFNLCPSDDADMIHLPDGTLDPRGDSLNWQFNFGENPARPAFDPITGRFNPDYDQFCRVEHVYERAGTYVATLSVTDKHLEDQGRGASALARTTTRITVNAFPVAPAEPPPSSSAPVILTFTATGGCPANLSWTTSNATSASISPGVGAVPVNGSTIFDFGTNPVSCTLTATGPGGIATRTITCPGDNNC